MGNFRTDEDYINYGEYDNPEFGNGSGDYGSIRKKGILSKIIETLCGAGATIGSGITLEKILLAVYVIAMIAVVLNIGTVLDFLFYTTMSFLQYVIMILVVAFFGFIIFRYVLKLR